MRGIPREGYISRGQADKGHISAASEVSKDLTLIEKLSGISHSARQRPVAIKGILNSPSSNGKQVLDVVANIAIQTS